MFCAKADESGTKFGTPLPDMIGEIFSNKTQKAPIFHQSIIMF